MTARDRLNAFLSHDSDEAEAEFAARVDAVVTEVLSKAAHRLSLARRDAHEPPLFLEGMEHAEVLLILMAAEVGQPAASPQDEYPGELAHLRDLLRDVGRLADTQPEGNPLTELLIDHYSDSRMVDAQLAKGGQS